MAIRQRDVLPFLTGIAIVIATSGCGLMEYHHRKPHITAYGASPDNQCSPPGIPFYLPKPMLVISKNFYHVEDAKVGLTGTTTIPGSFDSQAGYGNLSLQTSFTPAGTTAGGDAEGADAPGAPAGAVSHAPTLHSSSIPSAPGKDAIPNDGLGPHMFFTYEIVFVPDLTQKYVLEVNGGAGEIRAAMNLVNGWQFTGLGPYYMKDSSTAQNILASGLATNLGLGGASDVINSVAQLKNVAGKDGTVDAASIAAVAEAMADAQKTTVFDTAAVEHLYRERTYEVDGVQYIEKVIPRIERYAEIYVYEGVVQGGQMVWSPVANHQFDREFLGVMRQKHLNEPPAAAGADGAAGGAGAAAEPLMTPGPDAGASRSFHAPGFTSQLNQVSQNTNLIVNALNPRAPQQVMVRRSQLDAAAAAADDVFPDAPKPDDLIPVTVEGPAGGQYATPQQPTGFDPALTHEVFSRTLAPPAQPCKKGFFAKVCPWHRSTQENRIVDHTSVH